MHKELAQITCRPDQAQKLVEMGFIPKSIFWQHFEEDHTQPNDKDGNPVKVWHKAFYLVPGYRINEMLPAWTMEEINVFLGMGTTKIDFEAEINLSRTDKDDLKKGIYVLKYAVYKPNKQSNYVVGAQAAADWLIFLMGTLKDLEREHFIKQANARYNLTFKA